MEPKHLVQLAVILDKGSITAAAEQLLLTQPTLTRNMNTLEMQAGGPLFSRSRFGAKPTALGEGLAREGRAIAQTMMEAQELLTRHKMGLNNQLRVGVGPIIGMAVMPQLAGRMLQDHPNISLTVTTDRPQRVFEQLVDGEQDVVIAPSAYALAPHGISRILLTEDTLGLFCGLQHPLAKAKTVDAEALSACEWLNVGTTSPFQNVQMEVLAKNGVAHLRTQFVSRGDAVILLSLMTQGRHLAILPRRPIALIGAAYPLKELPLPNGTARRDLYVWTREEWLETDVFTAFLQAAQQAIQLPTTDNQR